MSKIGVAVGEDFPLQDLDGLPPDPPEECSKTEDRASEAAPGRCGERCSEEQSEFARWKWRREGQRLWDADVRNERAEWEARKRAFQEKIRSTVRDAVRANVNRRDHRWRHSWRSLWPSVAGIGLAALALAIHRQNHRSRAGACRYYDDSDIQAPPHDSRRSPPPDNGEPIVTPPPPREY